MNMPLYLQFRIHVYLNTSMDNMPLINPLTIYIKLYPFGMEDL